jgi:hypothetical protein
VTLAPVVGTASPSRRLPEGYILRSMISFDYSAPAELFAAHGRKGLRYRRFSKATEAIQYAVEKLPVVALPTTSIEVDHERYDSRQIRALYYDVSYPLARK